MEREYKSAIGPFKWSMVNESVGTPALAPETTVIEWRNRTLYKAQREFQEKVPSARVIKVENSNTGTSIQWADGEFRFHLTIEAD